MLYYQKYNPKNDKYSSYVRCKGIMKNKAKKIIIDDYKRFVDGDIDKKSLYIYHFRSFKHEMYTCHENKIGLTYFDDKRYFKDNYETLPYGYTEEF